ncbi:spore germination protein GerMN [Thermacetogenium phaeum DSM 12270]|uniref:Spore germination protein GerMN n=2 Tax=Thermacetogenium phaeum TaxID=85874 RepID=K4LCK0_THEPS|nr:GerMN domain-containing protein [Thermacetogenium phaeum]AFV10656.1 spore germination protein GerMN [Thermacetogenium phaeum DSM 12270]KUK35725.1 MAG: Spore germination protein GerMN [Thermacetogenium phaeum]
MAWDFRRIEEEINEQRRRSLYYLILMVLVLALMVMGGCTLRERLGAGEQLEEPVQEEFEDPLAADVTVPPEQEMVKVVLYFLDADGRYLVAEAREIPKVEGIARAALDALCEGETEGELSSALPPGAEVLDLNIKPDGSCVVDLNLEATKIPGDDPRAEALAVYSVVNTLTEFPTVKSVQILVEGQNRKTFAKHIPVDTPLLRNLSFVKS